MKSFGEFTEAKAPSIGKKGMVQGKDGKNYKIEMIPSNRSIEFKITNEFGDFETISVGQLAKKFR
jgi:hypothetical protein